MNPFHKKLWIGIVILALLSHLGLILPRIFKAGGAWGEWGTDSIKQMLGFVPAGLARLAGIWKAPLPDYGAGAGGASMTSQAVWYIASGLLGVGLAGVCIFALRKALGKR